MVNGQWIVYLSIFLNGWTGMAKKLDWIGLDILFYLDNEIKKYLYF